jgi:FkbM family methyltransferase
VTALSLGAPDQVAETQAPSGAHGLLAGVRNLSREAPVASKVRGERFGEPPLWLRYGTVDPDVVFQVAARGEYDVRPQGEVGLVIDGGAHIGVAARRFAAAFPEAKVIAVEPDRDNFELLLRNTSGFANVECVNAAIMAEPGPATVTRGAENWLHTVAPGGDEPNVAGVTVGELIARSGLAAVDILKLDIEGTERDLFEAGAPGWLNAVGTLLVELHDWARPGCSRYLYRATADFEYEWRVGEIVGLARQRQLDVRAAAAVARTRRL